MQRNTIKMIFVLLITTGMLFAMYSTSIAAQQWNYINPPEPISKNSLPIIGMSSNFVNDNTIFMATGFGIYESKDGGINWADPRSHKVSPADKKPDRAYGAESTAKKPMARICVSPNFNSNSLLALSNLWGHYVADLSPDRYVQFVGVTPLGKQKHYSRSRHIFDFLQGFTFGPNGTMYAASGLQIFYGNPSLNAYNPRAWKELSYIGDYTYDIKLSPNFSNDQTIIIQTGRGVLISTDGGNKFTLTSLPSADGYYDIAFSPNYADDGTIAVVVPDAGLFLSTDRGDSWKNVFPGKGMTATAIGPSGAIYAGTDYTYGTENGVYVSYDEGQKWQRIGLENSKITSLYIFKGTEGDLVYAGTDTNLAWTTISQSVQSVKNL